MKKNCYEGIYSRKLLSKEKEQKSLPSVTTLMETCFRWISERRKKKKNQGEGSCSLWMSSSHWYYSRYTCMVCTINSAGQARTRHDTSLGYLHLLAKEHLLCHSQKYASPTYTGSCTVCWEVLFCD